MRVAEYGRKELDSKRLCVGSPHEKFVRDCSSAPVGLVIMKSLPPNDAKTVPQRGGEVVVEDGIERVAAQTEAWRERQLDAAATHLGTASDDFDSRLCADHATDRRGDGCCYDCELPLGGFIDAARADVQTTRWRNLDPPVRGRAADDPRLSAARQWSPAPRWSKWHLPGALMSRRCRTRPIRSSA